jgi:HAD superfamily hydrolase (TIGR01544 family)
MRTFVRTSRALLAESPSPFWVKVPDRARLAGKLRRIVEMGPDKLLVISDFDYTLTQYKQQETNCDAVFSLFTDPRLPSWLVQELTANYRKYGPLELSPELNSDTKRQLMDEFYGLQLGAIARAKLTQGVIQSLIDNCRVVFRKDCPELLQVSQQAGIPFLVVSGGIKEIIRPLLEALCPYPLLRVYSNHMLFEEDTLVAFRQPFIHSYNKYEKSRGKIRHYGRPNCLLLGDQSTDFYMDRDCHFDNRVTIYLSRHEDHDLKRAERKFDILIGTDPSLKLPLTILQAVAAQSLQPLEGLSDIIKLV